MNIQTGGMYASPIPSSLAAKAQQHRQDLKDVMSSLKAGDLSGAQQAYTDMTATSAIGTTGSNPLAQIGQALQAGDLAGAQQAAKDLVSTRAAWRQDHAMQPDGKGATPVSSAGSMMGTQLDVTA